MARWVSQKNPVRLAPDREGVVGGGVVGERLGDERARVVDQGVDAAEPSERSADDAVGGLRIGDVSGDGEQVRVPGRLDRAGAGHHRPALPAVAGDKPGADAPGGAADDGDLACHGVLIGGAFRSPWAAPTRSCRTDGGVTTAVTLGLSGVGDDFMRFPITRGTASRSPARRARRTGDIPWQSPWSAIGRLTWPRTHVPGAWRVLRGFPVCSWQVTLRSRRWRSSGGPGLVALTPHVPGRGLDRQPPRVVPGVLVVAGLGLIGPDLNCQGGSVSDCAQPASRGAV